MKIIEQFCKACGQPYYYQLSGCRTKYSDTHELYCPDCMKLIKPVLNSIPQIYGMVCESSNDYTLDELINEYEKQKIIDNEKLLNERNIHKTISNEIVLRKLFPESIKSNFSDILVSFEITMPNSNTYFVSYWKNSKELLKLNKKSMGDYKK